MTHPPAKFNVAWSKETQVIVNKNLMFDLKPLFLASWQAFYSPIDPQKQSPPDMIYLSAKFDVDWSKETQVIVKKNNVWRPDAHPPARPLTSSILITRFRKPG